MINGLSIFAFIFCFSVSLASQADNDLRIAYTYGHEQALSQVLLGFEKSTHVRTQIEFTPQDDLKPSMMKMMELHTTPDAIIMPADHVGMHEYFNYSEIDSKLFKATISDRIWGGGISDGKLYGAPFIQGNYLVLYYNKSLVGNPASDWPAMFAQKAGLTSKGVATIAWSYKEPFWFIPFFGAFGGWPIHDGKVEFNTPNMIAALDAYKELIKQLAYPNCNSPCVKALFSAGKVAYTISGEWEGADFFRALGNKLGVSAIPSIQGKKIIPSFSTYVVAFPRNSLNNTEKRANLIKLVNYLQSPAIQQQLWEQVGAIPVEAAAFTLAQKKATGYLKETLGLMVDAKPLPAEQVMSFLWEPLLKGLARHREGALDSKSTALYMQQLAERYTRNTQPKSVTPKN